MKGIRFYLEYDSPRAKRENRNNLGNIVATLQSLNSIEVSAWVSFDEKPNSERLHYTILSKKYIKSYTYRVSEAEARIHHPKLFEVLDNLNAKQS